MIRFLAVLAVAAQVAMSASLPLRVTSFNIRLATPAPGINEKPWWSLFCFASSSRCRQPHVINHLSQIAANATDGASTVFGLQEVLDNQLNDILKGLGSDWRHIGVARDDGVKSGEYSPIIYRSGTFSVLFSETKWLSPTPDQVSFGWGAGSRRVVTIGVFQHITTGKRFIHANTHLDNVSAQARNEGVKVVIARIKTVQATWGPLAVMLTGDFNSEPNGQAYQTLVELGYVEDIWNVAPRGGTNQLTYTGFTTTGVSRIDYVWLGPTTGTRLYTARKIEFMSNVNEGVIFSDHRSVVGDITLL